MNATTYTELQRVPGRWVMLGLGISPMLFAPVIAWWAKGPDFPADLSSITMAVVCILFGFIYIYNIFFCQIDLKINNEEIHYQLFPRNKGKFIAWADIDRVSVREFVLHGEYPQGKGMFRQGPNGWAHSFTRGREDNYGLQIEKKSGVNILIGTRQPDELREFLADIHPVVQV